jgi:hypothetical protein
VTWFRLKQAIVDLLLWFLNAKVLAWDLVMFVLLKLLLVLVVRWSISFEGIVLKYPDLECLLWLYFKRLLLGILNSNLPVVIYMLFCLQYLLKDLFCVDFFNRPYRWSWKFITFERIIVRFEPISINIFTKVLFILQSVVINCDDC